MHVHQTFLYISLTSVHEYDVKFSQVTFYDVDVRDFFYYTHTTVPSQNYIFCG